MERQNVQRALRWLPLAGFLICLVFCAVGWRAGIFNSQEALHRFITGCGTAGIGVFIFFQAVQVVIPILPGGLGCLAGVLLFGAWQGFLFNYIGICIGSILAFVLARCYGRPLLVLLFGADKVDRYHAWTEKNDRFTKLFAFAIFFPVAPDDILCFMAGTTAMRLSQFTAIILLAKPFAIALYSLGLMTIFDRLTALFSV